jgi:gamma-glutamyl hercynylcysteine S-oxide synthase
MSGAALGQLATAQALCTDLVETIDEAAYRTQYHEELSPLGWHLGHCIYFETYWIREVVRGDDRLTAPLARLYMPPHTPKPERGAALPPRWELVQWAAAMQSDHLMMLANPGKHAGHPLLEQDYLAGFLVQHYAQHFETMLLVQTQRALRQEHPAFHATPPLQPAPLRRETRVVSAGHYRIGGERPRAYDNELPPQRAELGTFAIAVHPVSNAEYLAFMEADGYREAAWWSEAGWAWREAAGVAHPEHWRRDPEGHWYGVGLNGPYVLAPDAPVHGINHHEASAFAAWAGARLPHEYQWETACRLGLLEEVGRAWEWCANPFHPYQGFEAFPYEEYSKPWFDGRHYPLRGGSIHTRPPIRRPSFRNFYAADKRHIVAGLRLVF